jgi:glycosyltransferase involved in cell wall biosynthesis
MEPMRILHLLPDVREVGNGIVNSTVDLMCEESSLGHEVSVVSSGGEYEALLVEHGVTHVTLSMTRSFSQALETRRRLRDVIGSANAEILHAHTVTTAVAGRGAYLRARPPLVTTVHNEFNRSAPLMAVGDRVIAPSEAIASALRRRGLPRRKLRVVLNGPLGGPRTKGLLGAEPIELQHPAVVTIAGMYERKGIGDLIDAFGDVADHVPNSNLYLVGEGPDRLQFERQASGSRARDRIHFVGYQREPSRYLASADVFVLASRRDPSPLVVPEARQLGCAIVATDADGIPELLDMGKAGMLVPVGNREALAGAIEKVLTDDELRSSLRRAALENIERLSVGRVAQETLAVYRELVG